MQHRSCAHAISTTILFLHTLHTLLPYLHTHIKFLKHNVIHTGPAVVAADVLTLVTIVVTILTQ
jgi:hypothetical protein